MSLKYLTAFSLFIFVTKQINYLLSKSKPITKTKFREPTNPKLNIGAQMSGQTQEMPCVPNLWIDCDIKYLLTSAFNLMEWFSPSSMKISSTVLIMGITIAVLSTIIITLLFKKLYKSEESSVPQNLIINNITPMKIKKGSNVKNPIERSLEDNSADYNTFNSIDSLVMICWY